MFPPSSTDIVSQRRGSAASSVSVTIETTTTSTASTPGSSTLDVPLQSSTVEPFAGRSTSPHRAERALPPLPPTLDVSLANAQTEEGPDSTYRFPPPAYSPPPPAPSTATVTPLSFFAFSSLTPVSSTFPALPSSDDLAPSSAPAPSPPPRYQETPRTAAERCFWWGFLLPLLWVVGFARLWRSETPAGLRQEKPARAPSSAGGDLEAQRDLPAALALREASPWSAHPAVERLPPTVEESLMLWREEERLWAKRCGRGLAALVAVAGLTGVIVASVTGTI
ncbi:hypothetical protein JCM8097_004069 [Rhodosporidiobolus ruineniae]